MINETTTTPQKITLFNQSEKKVVINTLGKPPLQNKLPEILFINSYPPRECGIATYSQDLIKALNNKFSHSFNISICALECDNEKQTYKPGEIKYTLNTDYPKAFVTLAAFINDDADIKMVMLQHEFGFFKNCENSFIEFLQALTKPVVIVFHTVLPNPEAGLKRKINQIAGIAEAVIVMTATSSTILINEYDVPANKINIIPHGTHLVPHLDKALLKEKYHLTGKKVLSTFGLLSAGKNIETTLEALPGIIKKNPDVLFLIIGKTHPTVVKNEGEKYRDMLKEKVTSLQLQSHVRFVNYFLPLPDLLEYLQLTDIYLFTSKDPNQAVSGTFSYAISCGCPVISTPIPHAKEVLKNDTGILIDFENSQQLTDTVNKLLANEQLRKNISSNSLHHMASTAWENAAIAHALLMEKIIHSNIPIHYTIPVVNLNHIKKLTSDFGMIQFSVINQPDINSGYTIDDNARAIVAMCQHFELTKDTADIKYITIYLNFIKFCQQPNGNFVNYADKEKKATNQNNLVNLEDSNGRAIWALGYLISLGDLLPVKLVAIATSIMQAALLNIEKIHSTRAMAFVIKGLYYCTKKNKTEKDVLLLTKFANRLVQMYRHEANKDWQWFESYLTYGNSILPEAMLCAWLVTGNIVYKEIALSSFDFLLSKIFKQTSIHVISNKGWLHKGKETTELIIGGEQPIDVAYNILALSKFYDVFNDEAYLKKMEIAFNWFLGNNHLHQIIYNPCTGGCYDGLEQNYVNLNQGAESTVSYLMARLTMEKLLTGKTKNKLVQFSHR
jgi:glycosyltransferase involved in cell wall biosynthesis